MQISEDYCCSVFSSQHGEAMFGTASRADVWLLLEYNGAWGQKAFKESLIPGNVKSFLSAFLDSTPNSKLLLVKSSPGLLDPGISFFIGKANEIEQSLYEFKLDGYEDLMRLNLQAILAGDAAYEANRRDEPLFLVCTNGRRDTCCAMNGLPVYMAMFEAAGSLAWQSTHLGGHRFAGNSVCLPHGIYYGRLSPADSAEIVETYRQGEITLKHLRGRACYPPAVQAGEYFLRRQSGILGLDAFHLLEAHENEAGKWTIQFKEVKSGVIYRLVVSEEISEQEYYPSCRQDKISHLSEYKLKDYSPGKI